MLETPANARARPARRRLATLVLFAATALLAIIHGCSQSVNNDERTARFQQREESTPAEPAFITDDEALEALVAALNEVRPQTFEPAEVEQGQVKPVYWPANNGVRISFLHRAYQPGLKHVEGFSGRAFLWIMERGYDGQPLEAAVRGDTMAPPAEELARWRGRRVLTWPWPGPDWRAWHKDAKAALQATDTP